MRDLRDSRFILLPSGGGRSGFETYQHIEDNALIRHIVVAHSPVPEGLWLVGWLVGWFGALLRCSLELRSASAAQSWLLQIRLRRLPHCLTTAPIQKTLINGCRGSIRRDTFGAVDPVAQRPFQYLRARDRQAGRCIALPCIDWISIAHQQATPRRSLQSKSSGVPRAAAASSSSPAETY